MGIRALVQFCLAILSTATRAEETNRSLIFYASWVTQKTNRWPLVKHCPTNKASKYTNTDSRFGKIGLRTRMCGKNGNQITQYNKLDKHISRRLLS